MAVVSALPSKKKLSSDIALTFVQAPTLPWSYQISKSLTLPFLAICFLHISNKNVIFPHN